MHINHVGKLDHFGSKLDPLNFGLMEQVNQTILQVKIAQNISLLFCVLGIGVLAEAILGLLLCWQVKLTFIFNAQNYEISIIIFQSARYNNLKVNTLNIQ